MRTSLGVLVLATFVTVLGAQQGKPSATMKPTAPPATTGWTPPKTSWGDPDLQGIWSNDQDNVTPFERPRELGTRGLLTDAEYAKKVDDVNARAELRNGGTVWLEPLRYKPSRRTSLVIDPPDGRLPPLTAEAQKNEEARVAARRLRSLADSWEDFSLWSRCITRSLPGAWIPFRYNNNRQFLQIPGYVIINYEEIHDVRIIPLDGRPHVGSGIRQWMGDSRGHWEGNTLVVDVTNFRDRVSFKGSPTETEEMIVGRNLRLTERFTRIDADTMDYKAIVNDPETFTKPWTLDIPMTKDDSQDQILEYACHEGNLSMTLMLGGARAADAEAEAARKNRAGTTQPK